MSDVLIRIDWNSGGGCGFVSAADYRGFGRLLGGGVGEGGADVEAKFWCGLTGCEEQLVS